MKPHPELEFPVINQSYDFVNQTGALGTPSGYFCDLEKTVKYFETIDANVKQILTFVGNQPDLVYERTKSEWVASRILKIV